MEELFNKWVQIAGIQLSTEELQYVKRKFFSSIEATCGAEDIINEVVPMCLQFLQERETIFRKVDLFCASEVQTYERTLNALVTLATNTKKRKFDQTTTETLSQWLLAHHNNPYPTKEEKHDLCLETGLSSEQLNNWFSNTRRRKMGHQ